MLGSAPDVDLPTVETHNNLIGLPAHLKLQLSICCQSKRLAGNSRFAVDGSDNPDLNLAAVKLVAVNANAAFFVNPTIGSLATHDCPDVAVESDLHLAPAVGHVSSTRTLL